MRSSIRFVFILFFIIISSCSSQKPIDQRVKEYCTGVPSQTMPAVLSNDEEHNPVPSLNSDRKMAVSDCIGGEIPADEENVFDPADKLLRE